MTLDELKTLVTPEGVKNALDDQIFDSLAFGDGENVTSSCKSAAIWCYSYLAKTGNLTKAFSQSDKEVISAAMVQMAIYHLNAHHFFSIDDPKDMAQALIDSILGISQSSNGTSVYVGAAVAKDEKSNIVYKPSGRPTRWNHR
ncbi:hypothetical protein [Vibrio sp. OPT18]|uniref:hypothetical protein n=1 Tax=Vibrio sp. OPT18 TaxID=2778641 RepID=UPI00187E96E1|nr:hypothetical protein [Vibrio sp. OPT18]MBE8578648.1 hypothetical protein [Vibrio sp. OPT18]